MSSETPRFYPEPTISKFLFASKVMAPVWAVIRIYLGFLWLRSGWGKVTDPAWVGPEAGGAVRGFLTGALELTTGDHPSVQGLVRLADRERLPAERPRHEPSGRLWRGAGRRRPHRRFPGRYQRLYGWADERRVFAGRDGFDEPGDVYPRHLARARLARRGLLRSRLLRLAPTRCPGWRWLQARPSRR